ncbi:hypothetical protein CSAL01_13038, partial [Colletotrichum salicis]
MDQRSPGSPLRPLLSAHRRLRHESDEHSPHGRGIPPPLRRNLSRRRAHDRRPHNPSRRRPPLKTQNARPLGRALLHPPPPRSGLHPHGRKTPHLLPPLRLPFLQRRPPHPQRRPDP